MAALRGAARPPPKEAVARSHAAPSQGGAEPIAVAPLAGWPLHCAALSTSGPAHRGPPKRASKTQAAAVPAPWAPPELRPPGLPSVVGAIGTETPLAAVPGCVAPRRAGLRLGPPPAAGPTRSSARADSPGWALPRVRLALALLPLAPDGLGVLGLRPAAPLVAFPIHRAASFPRAARTAATRRAAAPVLRLENGFVPPEPVRRDPAATRLRRVAPAGRPGWPLRPRLRMRNAPLPLGPRLRRPTRFAAGMPWPPPALRTERRPFPGPAPLGRRLAARAPAAAVRRATAARTPACPTASSFPR